MGIIQKFAEKIISEALRFKVVDEYKQERYFYPNFRNLEIDEPELHAYFHANQIKTAPAEIAMAYYECGIYEAVKRDLKRYNHLSGVSALENDVIRTNPKDTYDTLLENKLNDLLQSTEAERVWIVPVRNFQNFDESIKEVNAELAKLLPAQVVPVLCKESALEVKSRVVAAIANETPIFSDDLSVLLNFPSFLFIERGSPWYVYQKARATLKVVCDLMRISGYRYPGQVGASATPLEIYTPGMVQPGSIGTSYVWDEEEKSITERFPDGNLFVSFFYRGTEKMYIDRRNIGGFVKIFEQWKSSIEKTINNPYEKNIRMYLLPVLHLLSELTQSQSFGIKNLLLSTCLENMFVPDSKKSNHSIYIVGAMKAIDDDLVDWAMKLYQSRSIFAHKGYLSAKRHVFSTINQSIDHILRCLRTKI